MSGTASQRSAVSARSLEDRVRAWEGEYLWDRGTPSYPALRREPEEDSALRTPFQRDRDRIVHSKAFRRLKHKTQVFIAPEGDHYRTRLTHTLETCGIARTVARALGLNEDLTEAIGLGHDLGHPPFGHIGEEALDEALRERTGRSFRHNRQSLRVVDVLERDGRGLNLTEAVRDGILNHTGSEDPATLEGRLELLGPTGARRIDRLATDIVECSREAGNIVQSEEVGGAMLRLRKFMFERVYLGAEARSEHERVHRTLRGLFDHYSEHPEEVPPSAAGADQIQRITDYIAGMTDRFCIATFKRLALPEESRL
ncbi:MAG: deoxyguanosinetriphosphate triphosphohydrolase [Actinobacteria bacterium 13_1_20CM_3_68_9]|nr:MAG: deoxyguanosinetriphosphate triphosphohydrolase [Actinobacteria bacterium 13_1_20CM_3_68_9]